jgi:hypothetical protein
MIFWIFGIGMGLIVAGVTWMRRDRDFKVIMKETVGDESPRLERLEIELDRQAKVLEKFERMFKQIDFSNQSVDEIIRSTGMKKGEVLLLKRLLED